MLSSHFIIQVCRSWQEACRTEYVSPITLTKNLRNYGQGNIIISIGYRMSSGRDDIQETTYSEIHPPLRDMVLIALHIHLANVHVWSALGDIWSQLYIHLHKRHRMLLICPTRWPILHPRRSSSDHWALTI